MLDTRADEAKNSTVLLGAAGARGAAAAAAAALPPFLV